MVRLPKFLTYGIFFVGVQEFWVSYIWRGDFTSFLQAVAITELGFLALAYGLRRRLPPRFEALLLFLVMGSVGLIGIEWLLVGNTPRQSDASQVVMFMTWGGAAVFALRKPIPQPPRG